MKQENWIEKIQVAKALDGAKFRAIVSATYGKGGLVLMISQQIKIEGKYITDPTVNSHPVDPKSASQLQSAIRYALAGNLGTPKVLESK